MKTIYEYANWQRISATISEKLGPGVVVTDRVHEFEILGVGADHVFCFAFPDGFMAVVPLKCVHLEESNEALMNGVLEGVKRLHEEAPQWDGNK